MRVALVHDYFTQEGGAERVLLALRKIWPEAPVFTLLYDRQVWGRRVGGDVRTSFLDRLPLAYSHYRWMMPLMPAATEAHDLRGFEVVISSTSAFAKGVIVDPGTKHICYCHTPTRYLWSDRQQYVETGAPAWVRPMMPFALSKLRAWDAQSAQRVDDFIANSATVAGRIERFYGRESEVVHPPVDVARFAAVPRREGGYFLAGGRLVPYKRFDLVVAAANALGAPVKIFGDGPELARLKAAAWRNVEFVGRVDEEAKMQLYAGAMAFLNPQEEDFGITAIEAMAAGCPVIAYRGGGAMETVTEGTTGVFFEEQTRESLAAVMRAFKVDDFDSVAIRAGAVRFGEESFAQSIRRIVEQVTAKS